MTNILSFLRSLNSTTKSAYPEVKLIRDKRQLINDDIFSTETLLITT
ncbi:MAG: hypothetical protein ACRC80_09245 [Waterburya sp.]